MEYVEKGRMEIVENFKTETKKQKKKPVLKNGTIVFCRGSGGTNSFYGIVYSKGVLELEYGSDAYIQKSGDKHLGDTISYWTIESVCKTKLIIEEIDQED